MAKIKVSHDYPLTNDYMFATVMKNPVFCKELLNRIIPDKRVKDIRVLIRPEDGDMGEKIFKEGSVRTQHTAGYYPFSKSVRLDVTFEDDDTVYNIEMQVGREKDLPKRARYNSSQLDLEILPKGKNYMDLKASYVIFICTFDSLNTGKVFHVFESYDVKNELRLGDDRFTIIVNTKGNEPGMSEEVQNLFDYINSDVVELTDDFITKIDSEISWFNKEDGEWRRSIMKLEEKFMQARQDGINEGFERGKQEGIELGKRESLLETARKLKAAKIPYETILETTGIGIEEIDKL